MIGSISKAIMSVSKEIYLSCFDIKEPEIEHIIKSASNWERLVLHYCDIHYSKNLDFSGSAKYKIKFLSFGLCGHIDSHRKPGWMSTPSCFKYIVEAISKSGLRDSLQEVDIYGSDTMDKDSIQSMFNKLKMPHISVVLRGTVPIE